MELAAEGKTTTTTPHNRKKKKSLTHSLTPTSMLRLVNYCSELFKYT